MTNHPNRNRRFYLYAVDAMDGATQRVNDSYQGDGCRFFKIEASSPTEAVERARAIVKARREVERGLVVAPWYR